MNRQHVEPWDPFLIDEPATQVLPVDPVSYRGLRIPIQPYVLPHHSKIEKSTHQRASGPRGWNAHQGFYVYRSQRLLLPGDWLGLPLQKEEHYKLARIQVDLPNSMDDAWHIDVKKAVARPPGALRPDLARIAKATREVAAGVYRFRGKQIGRRQQGGYCPRLAAASHSRQGALSHQPRSSPGASGSRVCGQRRRPWTPCFAWSKRLCPPR